MDRQGEECVAAEIWVVHGILVMCHTRLDAYTAFRRMLPGALFSVGHSTNALCAVTIKENIFISALTTVYLAESNSCFWGARLVHHALRSHPFQSSRVQNRRFDQVSVRILEKHD